MACSDQRILVLKNRGKFSEVAPAISCGVQLISGCLDRFGCSDSVSLWYRELPLCPIPTQVSPCLRCSLRSSSDPRLSKAIRNRSQTAYEGNAVERRISQRPNAVHGTSTGARALQYTSNGALSAFEWWPDILQTPLSSRAPSFPTVLCMLPPITNVGYPGKQNHCPVRHAASKLSPKRKKRPFSPWRNSF